ncbi:hypothetical protein [Streptomyces sp. NPDC024089]|uniref:hypothetical protein n=1 Tax=Streptomyces sp. NPDC024089 TaxID=3154328 RepID=UPI0033F50B40
MIIVYTPAGGEPERYDAQSLKVSEASIVQRTIDQKWTEIRDGLGTEDIDAMRAIVWVLKKRSNPSLTLADVDPGVGELVTRFDKQEVAAYVERACRIRDTDPSVTGEQVATALADFPDAADDPEHAARLIEEMTAEGSEGPKAPVTKPARQRPSASSTSRSTGTTT